MKNQRLRQFSASFLVVLSLFVSSVSACICLHHTEKNEFEVPSCHEHSDSKQNNGTDSSEKVQKLVSNDECSCLQPAPKVFSKSETIKIEKESAVLPLSRIEIKAVSTIVSVKSVQFETPFYLTDSFYNLKSPRAPPRL